jgi:hypothetical protein
MYKTWLKQVGVALQAGVLAGCAGGGSLSTVVEALEGVQNTSPFVEAYIQYIGPDARWAGPKLWMLHVTARDGASPSVTLSPSLPAVETRSPAPEVAARAPASALGMVQMPTPPEQAPARKIHTTEEVRERLLGLAGAIQAADAENQACSTVVRVRLTRADGSVLERQGCRASPYWSQTVSEFSTEFMGASRYPAAVPGNG